MATRQEIYDRIRESSKNEVILEEMVRLGFWPADEGLPSNPASEIKRQGVLERELRKLTYENRKLENVEAIKRQQRKKRLEESKKKRQETKERRLRLRAERASAWKEKKATEITFLGNGSSAGLGGNDAQSKKLSKYDLQNLSSVAQLAAAMDVSVGLLRFLAYGRKTSQVSHYRRFGIKKKTGGIREISAPMPKLKAVQRWILDMILSKIEINECAHGFVPDRSIVSNAQPHVGAKVVINMDLENFFPSIHVKRIKGVFRSIGFSESVSTVLSMICSESETTELELDQQAYYVARGRRFLPQGAPTSPAITNLICRGLDVRLLKIAERLGFVYTRYADDITFSSLDPKADVGRAIRQIKYVIADEDFAVHPDKTRILRTGRRMEVTGLTVNEKVNVSRKQIKKFRATLFQIEKDGPGGKSWGNSENVIAAIYGYANFVSMVNPEQGKRFQQQVHRIIEKHGTGEFDPAKIRRERPITTKVSLKESVSSDQTTPPPTLVEAPSLSEDPKKPWWKLW